jgi:hypothetical protein
VVGREAPFHPDDNSRVVIQVEVADAHAFPREESPLRQGITFTTAAYLAAVSGLVDVRARPPEVRGVLDLER